MTRRTTVIQPSTQTDALYTLANQPFKRRIISASIYGVVVDGLYHAIFPELKINDVEGNVLTSIGVCFDTASGIFTPLNFLFADLGGSQWNLTAPNTNGSNYYLPATIPSDLCVPASNLLTVTLWGSVPGDTLPNLVLVTEDDDEDFLDA
jgi:hypothetical protein